MTNDALLMMSGFSRNVVVLITYVLLERVNIVRGEEVTGCSVVEVLFCMRVCGE